MPKNSFVKSYVQENYYICIELTKKSFNSVI